MQNVDITLMQSGSVASAFIRALKRVSAINSSFPGLYCTVIGYLCMTSSFFEVLLGLHVEAWII